MYVAYDQQKRIGTIFCLTLENLVTTAQIMVYALITAKPFFEKQGYQVIKCQKVNKQGVMLINYVMQKNIACSRK